MKITGLQTHAVTVDFEGKMKGTHVVMRLRTDQGLEGISYVSRFFSPGMIRPTILVMEALVEKIIGMDPNDTEAIYRKLYGPGLGAPVTGMELRAASAIDVACWDLKGKALGLPVWKLAGGFRGRMPVSANWGLMPGPEKDWVAKHLEGILALGFKAVKAPCGFATIEKSVEHVTHIREVVGPDVKIIVDCNFQFGQRDAIRFARETEELNLYWIEDPVAYSDYAGMREVTASVKQRICAGEVFQHPHQFARLFEERCSDFAMIDQDLGLTGFFKVAHMAETYGIPVVNHLASEVLAQGLAAVPNGLIVGLVPWAQPMFTERMVIDGGELVMSDRPGLGLELDENVMKNCAID